MNKIGFIFDLDGVIVDTAKFHFIAWQDLAKKLGINFTEKENEQLKGVSRIKSLEKILTWGNKTIKKETFQELMHEKNEAYLGYVGLMNAVDVLPGVLPVLDYLKSNKHPVALGSASKNAPTILEKVALTHYFDTIVDGNTVSKAKPNPEVFLKAAQTINCKPENCVVFEDSLAGIQAANAAGMISVGIGDAHFLNEANYIFPSFENIKIPFIQSLLKEKK
ncbi:MAG: beta-phosphoglucomutase [Flavobacteriales bacterium]|jgi:beta-phosphoglucomutase|nr:beta-phosphoglucomutase [Flavobacteriales bacterium]